jgi:hypothetical protein
MIMERTASLVVAESEHDPRSVNGRTLARKLEAAGWGLFFIWIGLALLADVGWGVGLLGVGIITLGVQGARKHFTLELDRFSVAVGFLFVVGGVWELFNVQIALVPILCIVAGVAFLVSALAGRPRDR